jgi:hypothetical protein
MNSSQSCHHPRCDRNLLRIVSRFEELICKFDHPLQIFLHDILVSLFIIRAFNLVLIIGTETTKSNSHFPFSRTSFCVDFMVADTMDGTLFVGDYAYENLLTQN